MLLQTEQYLPFRLQGLYPKCQTLIQAILPIAVCSEQASLPAPVPGTSSNQPSGTVKCYPEPQAKVRAELLFKEGLFFTFTALTMVNELPLLYVQMGVFSSMKEYCINK